MAAPDGALGLSNGARVVLPVLAAQIKYYKPDVVLNQAMESISGSFLKEVKSDIRLLVGQHAASPLPAREDFSAYDVVISSFPPTVERFRNLGIPAELSLLGFDPDVLSAIVMGRGVFDVTFVGSFAAVHSSRVTWLERLCLELPQLRIWRAFIAGFTHSQPL
jgi:spore maturation protein CgeB